MFDYTAALSELMTDVVHRVPELAFIDIREVFVFARGGRLKTSGPLATCHCLTVADSAPGYYFWRDRETGQLTRRTEVFITRQPSVTINGRPQKYLISFALPRFCDQSLTRSHKARFYRRAEDAWVAKLDTVIHELYHIAPTHVGIRQLARDDGTAFAHSHGGPFFEHVAAMVNTYLTDHPDPSIYEFLRRNYKDLERVCGGIAGTTFRPFPCYPRPFPQRTDEHDAVAAGIDVPVEPWKPPAQKPAFTEADLEVRQFLSNGSRRVPLRTGSADGLERHHRIPPRSGPGARRPGTPVRRAGDQPHVPEVTTDKIA